MFFMNESANTAPKKLSPQLFSSLLIFRIINYGFLMIWCQLYFLDCLKNRVDTIIR